MGDADGRRIAGFRVVMSWSDAGPVLPGRPVVSLRARIAGVLGALLLAGGVAAAGVAVIAQVHAPQPSAAAAGTTGASGRHARTLQRSQPLAVDIPAIGVHSQLLHLGVNADGSMRVPSLTTAADEAAWYKYSPTPGQLGASVIEGHVDTYQGPAVFYRLGSLRPGNRVDVRLADGVTAVFKVTGVREYIKSRFPAKTIYGAIKRPVLILITCGGSFDYATRQYRSSTVVFAALTASRRPGHVEAAG
jgi:Sortase domain